MLVDAVHLMPKDHAPCLARCFGLRLVHKFEARLASCAGSSADLAF
jgi:hypothetical protein